MEKWEKYYMYGNTPSNLSYSLRQSMVFNWLCGQHLWVILCHLPEKGHRREIEEKVEEQTAEGQGRKRKMNESQETKQIKTLPLLSLLLQA